MIERPRSGLIWNVVLAFFAVLMLLPIFWMLITSLKSATDVY